MEKKRVLLGMSGGIDSSVAAFLLKEEGYEVIGITMELWGDNNGSDTNASYDAKVICDKLGMKHYVCDFKKEFKEYVVDDFISNYKMSRTPNPCIRCNKFMKFDLMFKMAEELNADYIATGHYADIKYDDNYKKYVLKKSASAKKDQTYVLYNIPSDKLSKVLFPLARFEDKQQIREIANKQGFVNANKPDSQDICFIPKGDYVSFLKENADVKIETGDIINVEGEKVGTHKGLIYYTVGQRKGLGLPKEDGYYVVKIDPEKNQIIVGKEEDLLTKKCIATDVNIMLYDKIEDEINVNAQVRYNSKMYLAKIKMNSNGKDIDVEFIEKAKSVTPGQSIVFYTDDGIVVGGGIIK